MRSKSVSGEFALVARTIESAINAHYQNAHTAQLDELNIVLATSAELTNQQVL